MSFSVIPICAAASEIWSWVSEIRERRNLIVNAFMYGVAVVEALLNHSSHPYSNGIFKYFYGGNKCRKRVFAMLGTLYAFTLCDDWLSPTLCDQVCKH